MANTKRPKSYTVIYRTGGYLNFRWHKCLPVATWEKAQALAEEVRRQGYHALIHDTEALESIGLPETYGPNDPIPWE